jgi:integrase
MKLMGVKMGVRKLRKSRGGVYLRPGKRGPARFNGGKGWWWISYTIGGEQIREGTKALTKAEAMKIRSLKLTDHERGELRLPGRKKNHLLHSLSEQYFESARTIKKESSLALDMTYHRRIKDHFGNVPVLNITRADCEFFKESLTKEWQERAWAKAGGKKPDVRLATVDRYVGALKRLFNWAIDMEKMESNPAARVKLHRQESNSGYYLSLEQEGKLLKAADEGKAAHLKPIIILALATGMRKDEILGLEWSEVRLERLQISLPAFRTKGNRSRYADINKDAEFVLREREPLKMQSDDGKYYVFHREGKRYGDVRTAITHAVKRAGLPEKVTFHDLRHTVISKMSEAGIPENTIVEMFWSKASGHIMLRRYAHLRPENRRKAMKVLERSRAKHKLSTSFQNVNSQKVAGET